MTRPTVRPRADQAVDPIALWATARAHALAPEFPKYGSPAWCSLHPGNPARLAAALEAAELWRRYGDEQQLLDWFASLAKSPEFLARGRALAELDALARPKPAHQLRATKGWPPIRVPGQPGRHLYPQEGRRAA
ncbi:hypothetical protein [Streptomyces africanus]|uniref:hypothetical protein n=1 Tax=Streptomyces africanus TaxID=231024 RepID=UPI001FC96C89|nr:hypothetical protein [Streptomyces africanus]